MSTVCRSLFQSYRMHRILPLLTAVLLAARAADGYSTLRSSFPKPSYSRLYEYEPQKFDLANRIVKLRDDLYVPNERIMNAIASNVNTKVTVSDIALISGVDLYTTRLELVKIAALTAGELRVSNDGDICYTFDSDFRKTLSLKSNIVKLNTAFNKAKPFLFYLLRVSFGVMLLSSIVIVWTAIISASTSSSSSNNKDSDDRRSSGSSSSGSSSSGRFDMSYGYRYDVRNIQPGGLIGPSPFDILYYNRPYGYYNAESPDYYQTEKEYYNRNAQMRYQLSLLESFYSFVFGDGDPNRGLEAAQIRFAAKTIRNNKGIVVAEQLAPFVDPPSTISSTFSSTSCSESSSTVVDETCILGIVTKLGGVPVPGPNGDIFYQFEELMTTTAEFNIKDFDHNGRQPLCISSDRIGIMQEQKLIFSLADPKKRLLAGVLGALNLLGVAKLSSILETPSLGLLPASQYLFLSTAYPFIASYALLYVLVPTLRYFLIQKENALINGRNTRRKEWFNYLQQNQQKVDDKLINLKKLFAVGNKVISDQDYFYSTKRDDDAASLDAREFAQFDRKLKNLDDK